MILPPKRWIVAKRGEKEKGTSEQASQGSLGQLGLRECRPLVPHQLQALHGASGSLQCHSRRAKSKEVHYSST